MLQGLVLMLENFGTEPLLEPASFKYKAMLERQVTYSEKSHIYSCLLLSS